jgi:hypothetical protein
MAGTFMQKKSHYKIRDIKKKSCKFQELRRTADKQDKMNVICIENYRCLSKKILD